MNLFYAIIKWNNFFDIIFIVLKFKIKHLRCQQIYNRKSKDIFDIILKLGIY